MANENKTEKRDTLADIAAEMRTRSREVKEAFGGRPDGVENMLDIWADRIEAIAKREKAEAEANALAVGGIVEAARHKPGNVAAMREAVVALIDALYSIGCDEETASIVRMVPDMAESGEKCLDAIRKAKSALSAPARNCDKFTDAESARQAWLDDAENWDEFGSPELELHEWLLAPAAERKGEDDGR